MINIPLTPFAFQFLFHDAISFHFVEGTLVRPQNSAQVLFSLDSPFPTGQKEVHHPHLRSLDILDFNQR
jgi:hypothetical protein